MPFAHVSTGDQGHALFLGTPLLPSPLGYSSLRPSLRCCYCREMQPIESGSPVTSPVTKASSGPAHRSALSRHKGRLHLKEPAWSADAGRMPLPRSTLLTPPGRSSHFPLPVPTGDTPPAESAAERGRSAFSGLQSDLGIGSPSIQPNSAGVRLDRVALP